MASLGAKFTNAYGSYSGIDITKLFESISGSVDMGKAFDEADSAVRNYQQEATKIPDEELFRINKNVTEQFNSSAVVLAHERHKRERANTKRKHSK